MFSLTGYFKWFHIDETKFKRLIDARINNILEGAAREFVRKAYGHVPVDTGMARSAFTPLAHHLNMSLNITPKRTRKGKSPTLGEQQSSFKFESKDYIYSFTFSTKVFHYYLNEQYKIGTVLSSPWSSIPIGLSGAIGYIRRHHSEMLSHMSTSLSWKTYKLG